MINKGFTLIELLVVISIIALLSAISLFSIGQVRSSSRDARRLADLEMIRSGLELYKADCNVYPASIPASGPLMGAAPCPDTTVTYISAMPADPMQNRRYKYVRAVTTTQYTLCTALEKSITSPASLTSCNSGTTTCLDGGTCNYAIANP